MLSEPKAHVLAYIIGPHHNKTCLRPLSNTKGADQPAHPHRLISAFVIRTLESTIPYLNLLQAKFQYYS